VFDARSGRRATVVVPRGAAKPGDRVYLTVSRVYCPLTAGVKDYRSLGVWIAGPGLP